MAHRLVDKVSKALEQKVEPAFLNSYINALRGNAERVESRLQRTVILLVVTMILFELLVRGSVTELALGPVKVKDLAFAQKVLPIAIAYLYNQGFNFLFLRRFYRDLCDGITRQLAPSFYSNDLELFVMPPSGFIVEDIYSQISRSSGISKWTIHYKVLIVLGPPVFLVYAFWSCFSQFGWSDPLVWVGVAASIPFVVQTLILMSKGYQFLESGDAAKESKQLTASESLPTPPARNQSPL